MTIIELEAHLRPAADLLGQEVQQRVLKVSMTAFNAIAVQHAAAVLARRNGISVTIKLLARSSE